LRCAEPRYDPGGGGINVARAVRHLGGEATAVFPAGGLSGEMLCRLLADESVPHAAVAVDGITRESFAVVERQSGNQYRFLLPGPHIGARDQARCLDELAAHLRGAQYLVASGSLPPGCPTDFYASVGELTRQHGAQFVLDTSGPALRNAGTVAFLIKASLRELEELSEVRSEGEQEEAARQVIRRGHAEILVVSLGAHGALFATREEIRRFAAIPVPALSSIGAGDSMLAGIVWSLTHGWTPAAAVGFGMAAGAAALLSPGTELCRREDTDRLYRAAQSGRI
jgi:6-phosphofructokinase 2